jgi:hypothetical protein
VNKASGDSQTVAVTGALLQPLVAQITDQYGSAVAGLSVIFSSSSGTVTGSPATTDLNGLASVFTETGQ